MPSAAKPQFDNTSKAVDRERPFHRVSYKDFDTAGNKKRPDADGLNCGCTNKDDFKDIESDLINFLIGDQGFVNDFLKGLLGNGVTELLNILGKIPGLNVAAFILNVAKDFIKQAAERLHPKAVRAIPQWVPVTKGARNDAVDASQLVEVEGFVTRSYQNAAEVPLFQWHHWFNWSIHIRPEKGYEWVAANTPNPPSTVHLDQGDGDNMEAGERPITQKESIECQWDPGALWQDRSLFERGLKDDLKANTFEKDAQQACGPMFHADWAWPMTGQYAWASGRWVYDCGKSTDPEKDKPADPKAKKKPRMCAMLNPCKAIATARWEAFKFPENDGRVPAIQFMFFACKRGGYLDHENIDGEDYEFIVDLPELADPRTAPHPIGHTPDFPHNTIVLRPRLLKHVNTGAFKTAGGAGVEPIIEVIRPDQPDRAPTQVRVKIPLTQMKGAQAYGCIISLGWHDPLNVEASKVRACLVNISRISGRKHVRDNPAEDIGPIIEDFLNALADAIAEQINILPQGILKIPIIGDLVELLQKGLAAALKFAIGGLQKLIRAAIDELKVENEEWLLRVGVNGRWVAFHRSLRPGDDLVLSHSMTLFLSEQDRIFVSTSGGEIDRMGDVMFLPRSQRLLKQGSKVVTWKDIADSNQETRRKLILEYVGKLLHTLANENEVLGFIDARIDPNLKITDYHYGRNAEDFNPLWMDNKPHMFGDNAANQGADIGGTAVLKKTADFARMVAGPQCVYVEKSGDQDYILEYDITVSMQKLPED
jgi:hypothetical protein